MTQFASFVCEVAQRGDLPIAEAPRVVNSVVRLIGARLPEADAREVARRLPEPIGERLCAASANHESTELRGRLVEAGRREGLSERQLRATCQVVAETVDEQARAALRMQPEIDVFAPRGARDASED